MKTNVKCLKIRLIVANLCDKNFKLITKLSNILNVEGIIIKKKYLIKKNNMIKIYKSDHKMFFELIENLTNKEKFKEIDIDTRGFQKKDYHH